MLIWEDNRERSLFARARWFKALKERAVRRWKPKDEIAYELDRTLRATT